MIEPMAPALRAATLGAVLLLVVAIAAYLFLVIELSWAYGGPANSRMVRWAADVFGCHQGYDPRLPRARRV